MTAEQAEALLKAADLDRLKGKRDRALLAVLLACGLRRHEAVELKLSHLQQREEHWAIVDLVGKAAHTRTIPMPDWVKETINEWLADAGITTGRIFRRVNKAGQSWGDAMTEKVVWHVVKEFAAKAGIDRLARHDLRRTSPNCVTLPEANSIRFNSCWVTSPSRQPNDIVDASSGSGTP